MTGFTDDTASSENFHFKSISNAKSARKSRAVYFASKRAVDVIVCVAAMPVFAVLCAVVALLNLFWNPGPLFYCQTRMGKDQRKFRMVKFRTMLPEESSVKRGPFDGLEEWRITPFGRFMRMTRLDEIPQILNVIIGEMSLIGPRPEIFEFAQTYYKTMPDYHVRGTVRPGITGYSQVTQGYTDSEEMVREKTRLDAFYVRNMNWWLDLKVVVGTARVILTSHGAR
ncbi:sugar transferase [Ruegeria atlantica]|uniref:sugar transferase n=1 Tax=Ruegeria atlantica TaxID=81569 RepID=UPI002493D827|nr:sugar transferase [Ruegeria atlantica]